MLPRARMCSTTRHQPDAVWPNNVRRQMVNRIGLVVVAAGAAFAIFPEVAAAEPFVFACKVHVAPGLIDPSHGQVVDLPVLVSPESGTVNRLPAAITDGLITWVDNSGGPSNTFSFALDRKRLVLGVYDDTGRDMMVGTCVAPGQQSAQSAPSTPAPPPPTQSAQPFTLACRLEEVGPLMTGHNPSDTRAIFVDPIAGSAGGYPAAITAEKIRWKDATDRRPNTWIIDRITGNISVISHGGTLLLHGNCELSTGRKF